MFTRRLARGLLFAALLAAVALGLPGGAQGRAHNWSTVTVDVEESWGGTSMALDPDGDPMISYQAADFDLRFAICDLSASTNGNCDQTSDWRTGAVDAAAYMGRNGYHCTSIAVGADGDPMISYQPDINNDLRFAICDRSTSAHGNCDQTSDWSTEAVDALQDEDSTQMDIAVDGNGDPMISYEYWDGTNRTLRFAICDRSASAHGNCDQTSDWHTVTVDAPGHWGGASNSIAVDANGDPMISYYDDYPNGNLKFAICDRSASTHGNCDQTSDWSTVMADWWGGGNTSMAVGGSGDPMISYEAADFALSFAICDRSASTNGNCNQTADWSTVSLQAEGDWIYDTSIAAGTDGDPLISYDARITGDVRFAVCDRSASAHGNCDDPGDWSSETVDAPVHVGEYSSNDTSIAAGSNGYPMIAYNVGVPSTKFATRSPPSPPPPTAAATPMSPPAGQMHNCPQAGKWAISVWDGGDGADVEQALATCGEGAVAAAYYVDPSTQVWSRWFAGRPEVSTLDTLNNLQGVMALGGAMAGAGEARAAGSLRAAQGPERMQNCPLPAKWAISVWTGASGTATDQAVASCIGATVEAVYWIDPQTQEWKRYFAGRPGMTNLGTLDQMQGIIALGG